MANCGVTTTNSLELLVWILVMVADAAPVFETTEVNMALVVPTAWSGKFNGFGFAATTAAPAAAKPVPVKVVEGLLTAPEAVMVRVVERTPTAVGANAPWRLHVLFGAVSVSVVGVPPFDPSEQSPACGTPMKSPVFPAVRLILVIVTEPGPLFVSVNC